MASRLDAILAYHRARAADDHRDVAKLLRDASRAPQAPSLLEALIRPDGQSLRVIAEVKRRSPSAGELAPDLDVASLVAAYTRGGASALSVLTDTPHFGGSAADLEAARAASALPVLRKDFTVCANDVADARLMGASAVLLIVAALAPAELRELLEVAGLLGLDALVEVHDEVEQERALRAGALIVGVNQRDLATFEVDPNRAVALAGAFPTDVVTVAESGIGDAAAAARCAAAGYDAVLVGEALVRDRDPATAVAALRGDDDGVAA